MKCLIDFYSCIAEEFDQLSSLYEQSAAFISA